MNNDNPGLPTSKRKHIFWITVCALVPVIMLVVSVCMVVSSERQAANQLERLMAVNGSGNAWMAQRFRQTASQQGTVAWSKISLLCSQSSLPGSQHLPLVGDGELPESFAADAAWEEADQVAAYLNEMRPVVELIHQSSDVSMPVWQPMQFDGLRTLLPELQNSRSIARLLQLEAMYAVHVRDAERAQAAIRSLKATADAYDWHMFLVGELVHQALTVTMWNTIQRSLQADLWSEDQLTQLIALVDQPLDIENAWQSAFAMEQAWVMTDLDELLPGGLSALLSERAKLQTYQNMFQIRELGTVPVGELSRQASALEERLMQGGLDSASPIDGALARSYFPAIVGVARSFENAEYQRRLTLTALAIKKFQVAHQTWPGRLDELTAVGLSADEWSIPGLGQFGYEIDDDSARVFMYDITQPATAPALPATIRYDERFAYLMVTVH